MFWDCLWICCLLVWWYFLLGVCVCEFCCVEEGVEVCREVEEVSRGGEGVEKGRGRGWGVWEGCEGFWEDLSGIGGGEWKSCEESGGSEIEYDKRWVSIWWWDGFSGWYKMKVCFWWGWI